MSVHLVRDARLSPRNSRRIKQSKHVKTKVAKLSPYQLWPSLDQPILKSVHSRERAASPREHVLLRTGLLSLTGIIFGFIAAHWFYTLTFCPCVCVCVCFVWVCVCVYKTQRSTASNSPCSFRFFSTFQPGRKCLHCELVLRKCLVVHSAACLHVRAVILSRSETWRWWVSWLHPLSEMERQSQVIIAFAASRLLLLGIHFFSHHAKLNVHHLCALLDASAA